MDDPIFSTANWTLIDPQHYFSDSCATGVYGCTDILACNYDSLATIDDGSCYSLTLTTTSLSPSCFGSTDGFFAFITTDGVPPYLFSIDGINFTTQDQYYNMSAGTYTVAIQDSNGCVTSGVRTITEPTAISSIANINNVLCYGSVDGEISIFTTGGVPPYTYSFQGMTFSSTNVFVGLAAGSYFISTMDQNGCVDTNQYTITSPSLILSNLSTTNETSLLDDGSITVNASGGTPPYMYYFSNGFTSNPQLNLSPGSYLVEVIDANGCMSIDSTSVLPFVISGISSINDDRKNLIKTTDLLGRESNNQNQPLIYFYNDGTVEKKVIIE